MGRNNRARRAVKARARRASAGARPGTKATTRSAGHFSAQAWRAARSGEPQQTTQASGQAPRIDTERIEDEVSRDLFSALLLASTGDGPAPEQVVPPRLAAHARNPEGRGILLRQVRACFAAGLDRAWQAGWQPADLHRIVARQLDTTAQEIVTDSIAADLGRFAPSTLAARWRDQLRDIEAEVWWRPDMDPLWARARGDGNDFEAILHSAFAVLVLLSTLPRLEVLDPLPGQATNSTPRSGAPVTDEKVLTKVRAMLAKAESTPYEPEAEAFTAAAQKLMARHSIDAAMLASAGPRGADDPDAVRVGIDRPYEMPKVLLLDAVASANRCRTVWSRELGFVTLVGHTPDLVATETIFTSLLLQATRAVQHEGSRTRRDGTSRTRAFRSSFFTAFAQRIGERLTAAAREATEEAESGLARTDAHQDVHHRPGVPGQDLVHILGQRSAAVDARFAELFPAIVAKPAPPVRDSDGWIAGRNAAERAALFDPGSALPAKT